MSVAVEPVDATELLTRPLFRRDRKPGTSVQAAAPSQADQIAARRAALASYKLSGIVISDGYKAAILAKNGDPKMIVLTPGEDVEGWRISEIGAAGIRLRLDGETTDMGFPAIEANASPLQQRAGQ